MRPTKFFLSYQANVIYITTLCVSVCIHKPDLLETNLFREECVMRTPLYLNRVCIHKPDLLETNLYREECVMRTPLYLNHQGNQPPTHLHYNGSGNVSSMKNSSKITAHIPILSHAIAGTRQCNRMS